MDLLYKPCCMKPGTGQTERLNSDCSDRRTRGRGKDFNYIF